MDTDKHKSEFGGFLTFECACGKIVSKAQEYQHQAEDGKITRGLCYQCWVCQLAFGGKVKKE